MGGNDQRPIFCNAIKHFMTKGIIIIATASHIYGCMAYNLALTIKATGTTIPVAVIADEAALGHLNEKQRAIFETIIPAPGDWNKCRFNVDKLSPFDLTLQADADMLWLWRDPEELFAQHADVELLVTNEGYYDIEAGTEHTTGGYPWLADLQDTIRLYKLKGKLHLMRWEMLLFRKTDNVRKMFKMAEAIRKAPKLQTWLFEGQPVDEFAFYVAACRCGLEQAHSPWLPAYWCDNNWNPTIAKISEGYHAIGFGGNNASKEYRKVYDLIMLIAAQKMGVQHVFPLRSKNHYLTSRNVI